MEPSLQSAAMNPSSTHLLLSSLANHACIRNFSINTLHLKLYFVPVLISLSESARCMCRYDPRCNTGILWCKYRVKGRSIACSSNSTQLTFCSSLYPILKDNHLTASVILLM
ncbi:hypothetical protein M758_6G118300 [Ceratodon purpureus]|nr:hypothetical protein M758_6G118300 [Ceratodon purpureus]